MRIVIALLAIWVAAMIGYLAYEQLWTGGSGTLVVLSDPPGAEILLDLRPTSVLTGGVLAKVPAGEHSVTVQLESHLSDPFVKVVKVRSGKTDTVSFALRPLAEGKPIPRAVTNTQPTVPPAQSEQPDTLLERLQREQHEQKQLAESKLETREPEPEPTLTELAPPPPVAIPDTAKQPLESQTGVIEISSSVPGARITNNDQDKGDVTPANFTLPFGTYEFKVTLTDYTAEPAQQTVRVSRANSRQFVFFTLTPITQKEIAIETIPVAGEIFVDSVSVGTGKAVVPHNFGIYVISFGEVEGYRTPDPVRLSVTPSKALPEVQGIYTRKLVISQSVSSDGAVHAEGGMSVAVGIFAESAGFQSNTGEGPRIREIPGSAKKGWELAMGDPNKNPPGEDCIEFSFELTDDIADLAPLNLRLYIYRSPRRYPLSLAGKSELIVTVNGKSFLPAYTPRNNSAAAESDRYEKWTLANALKRGPNLITIRSAPDNTVYHYLRKIEIL